MCGGLALVQGKSVFSAVAHTKLTVLTNQSKKQAVMARHFFKVGTDFHSTA